MMKTLIPNTFLRRITNFQRLRLLSTAVQPETITNFQSFRTPENDPLNHNTNHLAQYYRVSPDVKKKLFTHGGIPKHYEIQSKTFNETCLMVRRPAVDLINCLKSIDYTKPTIRFVLYGPKGAGKSLTLAHVLHYAHSANFLLVHVPWVGNWMRRCKESSNSETKEGYIDLNIDAAAWLVHFKNQNEHLLSQPEFKISQDYSWSKREITPQGASLIELIDHAINRIKYASNCIVILAEEIKRLSKAGVCKTLVAIDGYNAFFYPNTRIRTEKKEIVHPSKIILTEAFLSLTKYDWTNAAAVVTVDEIAIASEDHKSHLPRYLLGKDGFEHLDPFVPILVNNYDPKELRSCLEYYKERKWITPFPTQYEELEFLSSSNPFTVMNLSKAL